MRKTFTFWGSIDLRSRHIDNPRIRNCPDFMNYFSKNRPILVYRFSRRALTLCPQLCMGIRPGARYPARSADALPATLYEHLT